MLVYYTPIGAWSFAPIARMASNLRFGAFLAVVVYPHTPEPCKRL